MLKGDSTLITLCCTFTGFGDTVENESNLAFTAIWAHEVHTAMTHTHVSCSTLVHICERIGEMSCFILRTEIKQFFSRRHCRTLLTGGVYLHSVSRPQSDDILSHRSPCSYDRCRSPLCWHMSDHVGRGWCEPHTRLYLRIQTQKWAQQH